MLSGHEWREKRRRNQGHLASLLGSASVSHYNIMTIWVQSCGGMQAYRTPNLDFFRGICHICCLHVMNYVIIVTLTHECVIYRRIYNFRYYFENLLENQISHNKFSYRTWFENICKKMRLGWRLTLLPI